jgi:hypothetical protein
MYYRVFAGILGLSMILATGPVSGQVITVDISDGDLIDIDPETATVADLPGPDGHISFSEAMIASNNTSGKQTIGFAIPTSEWVNLPWLYPGRAVIAGSMFYGNAYSSVTIDGTTQTAFTGDTNPDGHEVVILRNGGLYIPADDCKITGLDQTSVWIEGSNCIVANNSNMGINLYGGTGATVTGNTGGGYVQIDQSSNNVVTGNTLHRVRVLGAMAAGKPSINNRVGGPRLSDRNFIMGLGTLNSQGIPGGFAVQVFESVETVIENNWIGTTPDGLSQGHPYTTIGVYLDSENYQTVIRNNRIAGIRSIAVPPHAPAYFVGTAIQIGGTGSGVSIVGNRIGLNAGNEPVLGSVTGISLLNYYLGPVRDVAIGGGMWQAEIGSPRMQLGNEIAGQLDTGISVSNSFSGVAIRRNSLYDNGGLGIDLIDDGFLTGVTNNDILDTDTGANGLQNFPVIGSATLLAPTKGGRRTNVVGSLNSTPSSIFAVEFFASPLCDSSGFGEGRYFLGAVKVATDANGNAAFVSTLPVNSKIADGWFVTSTATNFRTGSTSEFSACVVATAPGQ